MILALDTSGAELVACLLDDALALAGSKVVAGRRHQDAVIPAVEDLLGGRAAAAGLAAIAVVRGPGSQTGLRVGMSTAEGMAFGGRLPLLPLDSLAVAAARAQGGGSVTAVVSAGRRRVYAQAFSGNGARSGPRTLVDLAQLGAGDAPALPRRVAGEPALWPAIEAAGLFVATPARPSGEALAHAVRAALSAGGLLAYHELTGDYGES